jgi:hypothetical protein
VIIDDQDPPNLLERPLPFSLAAFSTLPPEVLPLKLASRG